MNSKLVVLSLAFTACLHTYASAERERWEVADGGNGHWYEVFAGPQLPNGVPGVISWAAANLDAQARGGYLATITSAAENEFVFSLVDLPVYWSQIPEGTYFGPWLGGLQAPDAPDPASDWIWVTGEPFEYTNWHPGEPNDLFGILEEDRLVFLAVEGSTGPRSAFWNDESEIKRNVVSYVVEYVPEPATFTLLLAAIALFRLRQCVSGRANCKPTRLILWNHFNSFGGVPCDHS